MTSRRVIRDEHLSPGLVTTDSVLGASPAAGYAHSADRRWYSSVPDGCSAKDVAHQLFFGVTGSKIDVILGGGRRHFLPVAAESHGEGTEGAAFQNMTGVRYETTNRNESSCCDPEDFTRDTHIDPHILLVFAIPGRTDETSSGNISTRPRSLASFRPGKRCSALNRGP